jgi:hypothetical protein
VGRRGSGGQGWPEAKATEDVRCCTQGGVSGDEEVLGLEAQGANVEMTPRVVLAANVRCLRAIADS